MNDILQNIKSFKFKFSQGRTGLGLYVAAKIIEAHQGTIWADSPGKDQGSTFAFWVPVGEMEEGV